LTGDAAWHLLPAAMPSTAIERIELPDRETFYRRYVHTRTPVVITDLFAGDPIRDVRTKADAVDAFGAATLTVRPEYTSAPADVSDVSDITFAEYWRYVASQPDTVKMCTEYEIPARVMATFRLPALCEARDLGAAEVFGLPRRCGDHDLLSNVFVGNRGNKAHVHFDGDQRQVLLHQVFGRKQVILLQPADGHLLRPADAARPGFGACSFEAMTEAQKQEFVESAGGAMTTLYPGETIYIPMLAWHYLEYTDDAMSFNLRFGRNRYGRFMCVDNFHRDYYVQNFAALLADDAACASRYRPALDRVEAEYLRPAPDMEAKVRAMRALLRGLLRELDPGAAVDAYCPPEREADELQKILHDTRGSQRYADPAAVARTRPVGPLSPAQRRALEARAVECGLPADVLPRLLHNRVGKPHLADLTKAEAAQMMAYLRSPGAAW
jgi:hypothetical protein